MNIKTKTTQPKQSDCPNCGKPAGFVISVFMTTERRDCPHCGERYWMDYKSIDWEAVNADRIT